MSFLKPLAPTLSEHICSLFWTSASQSRPLLDCKVASVVATCSAGLRKYTENYTLGPQVHPTQLSQEAFDETREWAPGKVHSYV